MEYDEFSGRSLGNATVAKTPRIDASVPPEDPNKPPASTGNPLKDAWNYILWTLRQNGVRWQ